MNSDLRLDLLRVPTEHDDKYSRGVVGFVTGSDAYPGAAILGVTAAMRTGIGLVRYVGPSSVSNLLLEVRPETVCQDGRADAWVLGSGITKDDEPRVSAILSHLDAPLKVIDAGALDVIEIAALEPMTAILTPHAGELARLLDRFGRHFELDYEAVVAAATMLGQVVVLKGSMTLIASPTGEVVAVGPNPASLATAGTGDVLAGIMGALLASNAHLTDLNLVEVAKLAVSIHSEAARLAERSGPVAALDVAEAVREVVKSWQ